MHSKFNLIFRCRELKEKRLLEICNVLLESDKQHGLEITHHMQRDVGAGGLVAGWDRTGTGFLEITKLDNG